jgi:hypothetical protein
MAQPTKEEIIAELQRREGIEKELSSRLPQTQQMQPETQGYMQRLMQMPGGQALSRAGQAISGLGDIGFIKGLGYSFPRQVQERFGGIHYLVGNLKNYLLKHQPLHLEKHLEEA